MPLKLLAKGQFLRENEDRYYAVKVPWNTYLAMRLKASVPSQWEEIVVCIKYSFLCWKQAKNYSSSARRPFFGTPGINRALETTITSLMIQWCRCSLVNAGVTPPPSPPEIFKARWGVRYEATNAAHHSIMSTNNYAAVASHRPTS